MVWATLILLLGLGAGYYALGLPGEETRGPYGRFIGTVVAEWDPNGRDMKLTKDFGYVDPTERIWLAPANAVVNGASIPRPFWTLIGGPFEGKYRNASVVHDVACVEKSRPHAEVHRAFYDACRCGGVDERMSRILYAAVAKFGPTWGYDEVETEKVVPVRKFITEQRTRTVRDPKTGEMREETYSVEVPVSETVIQKVIERVPAEILRAEASEEDVAALVRMIDEEKPSLEEIAKLATISTPENEP